MQTVPTPRHYPIPRPAVTDIEAPRVSFGLLVDVSGVLVSHAFPALAGRDFAELASALDGFVYGPDGDPERDPSMPPGGPLPDGVGGWPVVGRDGGQR